MVVPLSDAEGTAAVAERVRRSLEASPVQTEAGAVSVTVSLGVAAEPGVGSDRAARAVAACG